MREVYVNDMRSAKRLKTIKYLKDHDSVMSIKEVKKLLGPKYKHTPNERVEHISMILNKISEHTVKDSSKYKSLLF